MPPPWFAKWRVFIMTSLFTVSALILWRLFSRRRTQRFLAVDHVPSQQQYRRKFPNFDVSNYHIEVVETAKACEEYLSTKIPSPLTIVGLDCEWCSESGIPVALLQLAFPNKECLLVRLCKMDSLTPTLTEILEDKSILKFGVGIDGDSRRLTAGYGLQKLVGCVDLQHIAVRSGIRGRTGLRGLSNHLLEVDLNKSYRLRCSDWETDTLSKPQVTYAAADAIVALHILKALVEMKMSKQDRRESSATLTQIPNHGLTNHIDGSRSHDLDEGVERHSDDGIEWLLQKENYSCMLSLCQGIVDVQYKQPKGYSAVNKHAISETKRREAAYIVRKTPLYHNCQLLAPDGSLLSTVDKKKLEWYLQRGLGTLVSESPLTVKLLFEPSGRPNEDRKYYLTEKLNVCVVCGREENCIRKNIVPHEYRRHFPSQKKEHLSHDVLLMCVKCHQETNRHDEALKHLMSLEYSVPPVRSSQKYSEDPWLLKIKNHAKALLRTDAGIPESRRQELTSTVAQYFDCSVEDVTQDLIQQASEVNSKSRNAGYVSHAEAVVSKVKQKNGGLFEFQKRWRQNFLDTMHPRFLPKFWSVDHNPQS